jgi:inorganic pyrophosphatase
MRLDKLPTGLNPPHDIYVLVEIPANGPGLKLELDKDSGALLLDRFLATPMHYPCNYGFIPHTLSPDGDPLDALVVSPIPLIPGIVVRCRPIGILETEDDAGIDAKVLCVPVTQLSRDFDGVRQQSDLPAPLIEQIEHFFAHYKDLEPGKWMRVKGWRDAHAASAEIVASMERYNACTPKPNF